MYQLLNDRTITRTSVFSLSFSYSLCSFIFYCFNWSVLLLSESFSDPLALPPSHTQEHRVLQKYCTGRLGRTERATEVVHREVSVPELPCVVLDSRSSQGPGGRVERRD